MEGTGDLLDYRSFAATVWRKRWRIITIGVIVAFLAAIVLINQDSIYVARSQVVLNTQERQVINIENVIDEPNFSDEAILSEIAVISSPPILLRAAERLNLAQYAEFNPDLREGGGVVSMLKSLRTGLRRLIFPSGGGGIGEEPSPNEIAAELLRGQLSVEQFGLSFVLQIEVESTSPRRAADIANAIADAYLDSQVQSKLDANSSATEWLAKRVEELRERLQEVEIRFEHARAQLAVGGSISAAMTERRLSELAAQIMQGQTEQALAGARETRFQNLIARGDFAAASTITSSDRFRRLIAEHGGAGADAMSAEGKAALLDEADKLASGLAAITAATEAKLDTLNAQGAALEREMIAQSNDSVTMRALESEVQAERQVYQTFLTRLAEARERGGFQEADARIVSRAKAPDGPAAPKRTLSTILAFIVGCLAAAAWILFRDSRREVFRTAAEVEAKIGLPVLAQLPSLSSLGMGNLMEPPPAAIGAVRRLVPLLRPMPGAGKAVLVTSVLPHEGSAELAILMAHAFVSAGTKVALFDADSSASSVIQQLSTSEAPAPFAIHGHRDSDATGVPPAERIDALREEYDLVVIHASPVLAAADTLLLSGSVDDVLVVFRWEATPEGAVAEAISDMTRLEIPLFGLVMGDVDLETAALYEYPGSLYARRQCARYAARL